MASSSRVSHIKYFVFIGLLLISKFKGLEMKMMSNDKAAPRMKYDVFVSFRGTDIRQGFLSHLITALDQKQNLAFVDDKLERGDEISQALVGAIEGSLISIAIFSQDYAASRWCLDELVKMLECREKSGQIVLPVFYNVDPSYVRHQNGTYKNAFANHTERYGLTAVETWKSALNKSANLSGFHSSKFRNDSELVEEIVKFVWMKLNHLHKDDADGRLTRVETMHLERLPPVYSNRHAVAYRGLVSGVRDGEISGMIGIGETTIERFLGFFADFDGCCFLANVSEELRRHGIETLHPAYSNKTCCCI